MNGSQVIPVVTGTEMAAVDRAMVEVCGLELIQVMETAGRSVAIAARHVCPAGPIEIMCGSGGNGGDAFVSARYLDGWGFQVRCWLTRPADQLHGLAAHQMQICQKLGISIADPDTEIDFSAAKLLIDGIFGFGLNAAPTGRAAELIEAANRATVPTLAIDLPSGVDATSGSVFAPEVHAGMTVTLGLPKQGLISGDGSRIAGTVVVADIGIPAAAYAAAGIPHASIFDSAEFVTLDGCPWPS